MSAHFQKRKKKKEKNNDADCTIKFIYVHMLFISYDGRIYI